MGNVGNGYTRGYEVACGVIRVARIVGKRCEDTEIVSEPEIERERMWMERHLELPTIDT